MTADLVISQLLLLDAEDSERDITLFINSPGGSITAGNVRSHLGHVLIISTLCGFRVFSFF